MWLKERLEAILTNNIVPYLDGISLKSLKDGVLNGDLQLRNLTFKPEVLALLGVEGFLIEKGTVGYIASTVPWRNLYKGKLSLIIKSVHVHVVQLGESKADEELIKSLRATKQRAVEVRIDQLRDFQLNRNAASQAWEKQSEGFAMRFMRKCLNNISIKIEDVKVSFKSSELMFTCSGLLSELHVMSTSKTFKERAQDEVVAVTGTSIYKVLRLKDLAVTTEAQSRYKKTVADVLSPQSVEVFFAHEPDNDSLKVKAVFGADGDRRMTIQRSHIGEVLCLLASLHAENARLRALLVAPELEKAIWMDSESCIKEYHDLHLRQRLRDNPNSCAKRGNTSVTELTREDEKRMKVLEDVLTVHVLAQQQWLVQQQFEKEVAQERAENSSRAVFQPSYCGCESTRLLDDETILRGELEEFESPQDLEFKIFFGRATWRLHDDVTHDERGWELLRLEMHETELHVDVKMGVVDHRGNILADWKIHALLGALSLHHFDKDIIKLLDGFGMSSKTPNSVAQAGQVGARIEVESRVEEDHNLLKLEYELAPMRILLPPCLIGRLVEFFAVPEEDPTAMPGTATEDSTTRARSKTIASAVSINKIPQAAEMAEKFTNTMLAREVADDTLIKVREEAQKAAQGLYDRIPDKMFLDLTIRSPEVCLPVLDLGEMIFSFGQLRVRTDQPCEYQSLDFAVNLDQTMLRVKTPKENFDIIKAVPINVKVAVKDEEDKNTISIPITVLLEKTCLVLAPQALEVLVWMPKAIAAISAPPEEEFSLTVDRQSSMLSRPTSVPSRVSKFSRSNSPAILAEIAEKQPEAVKQLLRGLREQIRQVPALDAAANYVREVRAKELKLDIDAQVKGLSVTCSDTIIPVLRASLELRQSGLKFQYLGRVDGTMKWNKVTVEDAILAGDLFNSNKGLWEPLVECFHFALSCGTTVSEEDIAEGHLSVDGTEQPLLINLTPTGLRALAAAVPKFIEACQPVEEEEVSKLVELAPHSSSMPKPKLTEPETKYRVINLCGKEMQLQFSPTGDMKWIEPTGSKWISLDELVLPKFAREFTVRSASGALSEPLRMEQSGAVAIPGTDFVAELLTPFPSYRLLIINTKARIHNQTNLAMLIQFHDEMGGVLSNVPSPTMTCNANLLMSTSPGIFQTVDVDGQADGVTHQSSSHWSGTLVLAPDDVCAIPKAAARLAIRPADSQATFCLLSSRAVTTDGRKNFHLECRCPGDGPPEVSVNMGAQTILEPAAATPSNGNRMPFNCLRRARKPSGVDHLLEKVAAPRCRNTSRDDRVLDQASAGVHFICEAKELKVSVPDTVTLSRLELKPMLTLQNATPLDVLCLRYRHNGLGQNVWSQLSIKRLEFACLHDLSLEALEDGLQLKIQLNPTSPWSEAYKVMPDESGRGETVELSALHKPEGATAGVLAEFSGSFQLRFSCPHWFVDRIGLDRTARLELHHCGRPLPCIGGVTLLPHRWKPRSYSLHLHSDGGRVCRNVKLPLTWNSFLWKKTPMGPLNLCMRAESVNPSTVLGASSHIFSLRPWLVLSNAAELDAIELDFGDERPSRLSCGASIVRHWQNRSVKLRSVEKLLKQAGEKIRFSKHEIRLRFRPEGSDLWSGLVVCSERAAGSSPFSMYYNDAQQSWTRVSSSHLEGSVDLERQHGMENPEVWSVEVAPISGAMAVTFKKGSEFKAVNRATKAQAQMTIWPRSINRVSGTFCVPPGGEQDYGWAQNSQDGKECSVIVEVALPWEENCRELVDIGDVRKTQTRYIKLKDIGFVLETTRQFEQSRLVLLDEGCRQMLASSFQVEVKLRQLGLSLIQEIPTPYELLFVHLADSYFSYKNSDADTEDWTLEVHKVQTDCQKAGRVEGQSIIQEKLPAVILANHGNGGKDFLRLTLNRHATSSRDLVLPKASIDIDWVDMVVDDDWLNPLLAWIEQCSEDACSGIPLDDVLQTAGIATVDDYQSPPLPSLLQCEQLKLSRMDITVWCSIQLKGLGFLPVAVRNVLFFITRSSTFTLNGAQLQLPKKVLKPSRGTVDDTMAALGSEYAPALILNARELFSRSSLNLLKAPFRFVARRCMNLGTTKASSRITRVIYARCACFARCRRRQEATELQKHRVRQRQPRLLFTEVGGVRLWSDLEAELLRQCDKKLTTGVQETLVLQEKPNSKMVLVLFSDRLIVAQLRYPYPQSSAAAESPRKASDPLEDLEIYGEFDEWLDEELAPKQTSRQSLTNRSLSALAQTTVTIRSSFSSLAGWDAEASTIGQKSVLIVPGKTLLFNNLRAVRVRMPETGSNIEPALLLTESSGVQRILPFSPAILREGVDVKEVLKYVAMAVRSAIAHPGRKAHWDYLHKTLHPDEEDRWHQEDRNSSCDWDRSDPAYSQDSTLIDEQPTYATI